MNKCINIIDKNVYCISMMGHKVSFPHERKIHSNQWTSLS